MKSIFKISKHIIKAFVVVVFLLMIISYINHKIKLTKEDKLFVPNGSMIEVNGHKIHVYSEGKGDIPLVFMSGGGTSSPVLDFKSLYSLLSDDYKIVVVEKAGYGFSDVVDTNRDIDTVLNETRETLAKAKIKGPFILFPHSMSGIEALHWSQKYLDEIKGIVGLDMAVPDSYNGYKINMPMIKLGNFAAKLGLTRLIPGLSESDAIKYGTLTDDEKQLYKIIFYRRTATDTMIAEAKEIKESAIKVSKNTLPNTPILAFVSNGQGTGWNEDEWKSFSKNTIGNLKKGKLIYLDCSHYVHDIEYEKIAKESKKFIENLNSE
ncbi:MULTISPECIES: alpha/beta hydrolase [Clostridium]|uniref:alpha/beta fold hydrolase n=1 Tax=Clostridium TaxID=1485 RepID=UPI00189AF200|nr:MULTISPECIES: alpha/beta hydrolase [Clostridium]MDI9215819.1 alpha/beta hydrolase [Clostridium tertium]